ncbi:MAG: four helix bundle protein [Ignavibacteriae bacterium]|nr:MAG: four helix bundle protein [Ignavibacteriota bacterium]
MHNFRKLKAFQKGLLLSKDVRKITNDFLKRELFSLTAQFQRAADSIVLNIAEGAGNRSNKEFAKFLDYAIRSAHECIGCIDIALENIYTTEQQHKDIYEQIDEIIAMLIGFQRTIIKE